MAWVIWVTSESGSTTTATRRLAYRGWASMARIRSMYSARYRYSPLPPPSVPGARGRAVAVGQVVEHQRDHAGAGPLAASWASAASRCPASPRPAVTAAMRSSQTAVGCDPTRASGRPAGPAAGRPRPPPGPASPGYVAVGPGERVVHLGHWRVVVHLGRSDRHRRQPGAGEDERAGPVDRVGVLGRADPDGLDRVPVRRRDRQGGPGADGQVRVARAGRRVARVTFPAGWLGKRTLTVALPPSGTGRPGRRDDRVGGVSLASASEAASPPGSGWSCRTAIVRVPSPDIRVGGAAASVTIWSVCQSAE